MENHSSNSNSSNNEMQIEDPKVLNDSVWLENQRKNVENQIKSAIHSEHQSSAADPDDIEAIASASIAKSALVPGSCLSLPTKEIPYQTESMLSIANEMKLIPSELNEKINSTSNHLESSQDIIRGFLCTLLSSNQEFRDRVIATGTISNEFAKYDPTGRNTPIDSAIASDYKEELKKHQLRRTKEEEAAVEGKGKDSSLNLADCGNICNQLLNPSNAANPNYSKVLKMLDDVYSSVSGRSKDEELVPHDHLVLFARAFRPRNHLEAYKRIQTILRSDPELNLDSSIHQIRKEYYCAILRKIKKNPTEQKFCKMVAGLYREYVTRNEVRSISLEEWTSVMESTRLEPRKFQQFIAKEFARFIQPKWQPPPKLECNAFHRNRLNDFLRHQNFGRHYFTPDLLQRGFFVWSSVGTGKTGYAIGTLSTTWEHRGYNILWVTRDTLTQSVFSEIFGTLKCGDWGSIYHKAVRDQLSNPDTREKSLIANSCISGDDKPSKELYDRLFRHYTNWRGYSQSKRESDNPIIKEKFAKANDLYETKSKFDTSDRVIPYQWMANTFETTSKTGSSMRMRNWGMAEEADVLKKTLLVIDEAHNIYNLEYYTSNSKNESDVSDRWKKIQILEQLIWHSYVISGLDSCRVMVLTATPVTNPILGIIMLLQLLNLLLPPRKEGRPNPKTFDRTKPLSTPYRGHFWIPQNPFKPSDADKQKLVEEYSFLLATNHGTEKMQQAKMEFESTIRGLVSYFEGSSNPNFFPIKMYTKPIPVPLSELQLKELVNTLNLNNTIMIPNPKTNPSGQKTTINDLAKTWDFGSSYSVGIRNIDLWSTTGIKKEEEKPEVTAESCSAIKVRNRCARPCDWDSKTKTCSINHRIAEFERRKKLEAETKKVEQEVKEEREEEAEADAESEATRTRLGADNYYSSINRNLLKVIHPYSSSDSNIIRRYQRYLPIQYNRSDPKIATANLQKMLRILEDTVFPSPSIKELVPNNYMKEHILISNTNTREITKKNRVMLRRYERYSSKYGYLFDAIANQDQEDIETYGFSFKHVIMTDLIGKHGLGIPAISSLAVVLHGYYIIRFEIPIHPETEERMTLRMELNPEKIRSNLRTIYHFTEEAIEKVFREKKFLLVMTSEKELLQGPFYFADSVNPKDMKTASPMDQRNAILYAFNDRSNVLGHSCRFLLLDSGFKEGISFADTRHEWLAEPPLSHASLEQIAGRVARYCRNNRFFKMIGTNEEIDMYQLKRFDGRPPEDGFHVFLHLLYSVVPMTGQSVYSLLPRNTKDVQLQELTSNMTTFVQMNAVDYLLNRNANMPLNLGPDYIEPVKQFCKDLGIP
jgi:hypothetical protein